MKIQEILVIDQNPKQQRAVCDRLRLAGFVPVSLDDIAQSREWLLERSRPVVVIDVDTVDIDNQAIREMKRWNAAAVIVALSGRSHHPELAEALQTDLFACLTKPIDPQELRYLLRDGAETAPR